MKISSIKNYFYSNEKRYSKEQLRSDFGEFPPTPLNCKNIDAEFISTRTGSAAIFFIKLNFIRKLLEIAESGGEKASPQLLQNIVDIRGLATSIKDLKDASAIFSNCIKLKNKDAPYLLALKILHLLIALKFRTSKLMEKGVSGIFIPMLKDEYQIFVINRKRRGKIDQEPIISHEHIHLLQFRNGEYESKIRDPGHFITHKFFFLLINDL